MCVNIVSFLPFQTSDPLEQGKWLSVLIKESGCGGVRSGSTGTGSMEEYTYVDEDEGGDKYVFNLVEIYF